MAKFEIFEKNGKKRKMFVIGNNKITSAGIVFYKGNDILMINNKDFGGKVEMDDNDIKETAAREAEEESNEIFSYSNLMKQLRSKKFIYIDHSKYAVFFVLVTKDIDLKKFGEREDKCGVKRTVEWVNYNSLKKKKINLIFRLRHRNFFKTLSKVLKKYPMCKKKIKIDYRNDRENIYTLEDLKTLS